MTRRRFALPILVLALVLLAAACGSDDDPTLDSTGTGTGTGTQTGQSGPPSFAAGTTMANLQQKGRIVVGTKFDQPLFGLKNPLVEGGVEGFDVEIAKLMAQGIFGSDIKGKVEFIESTSQNREAFIRDAKVDMVVATYTINDTRKQVVDFAGPYYIAGQDIMVMRDNNSITSVEDLNGKKVCSVQGSTSIRNVAQKAPQADLSTSFDKYSLCAEAMEAGRVEAVTTDNVILLGLIKDNPGKFKLVGKPFTTEPYGIGVKKGDDAFRTFLNDRLEEIYRNGDWKKAWDRTAGVAQAAPEPPPVNRYTSTPAGETTTTAAGGATTTTAAGGATTTSSTSTTR